MVKKTNLILGSIVASALYVGVIGTAQAQQNYDAEIRAILERIETKFNTYKDSFEDYYGISIQAYAKPTSADLNEFSNFKTDRNTLSSLFNASTNQNVTRNFSSNGQAIGTSYKPGDASSLTQEDLVSFMTIPYSGKDCADCSVTVESMREVNNRDLTFPYTSIASAEILSKSTVGNGYRNPQNTAPLNANSLLGPLAYAQSTVTAESSDLDDIFGGGNSGQVYGKNALSFIQHLTGMNRFRIYPKLPAQSSTNSDGGKARTAYLTELYSFAANISVGLSNIYQMYAARVPTSNGGKSKMQTENDMVMRHMKSNWQDSIKNGNPATVQKEMVFLLAEINYQLYQNRLLTERLLLTQSVMEIAASRGPRYDEPMTN